MTLNKMLKKLQKSNITIEDIIKKVLVELKPEHRYLICLPNGIRNDELESLQNSLRLDESNTYVAIIIGDIKIVEFS